MIIHEIKALYSADLGKSLPADVEDCIVGVTADIGIKGSDGADQFQFDVVTPKHLARSEDVRWGRGYLIVPFFSWPLVEEALGKLLMHCRREDWDSVASEIAKELHWEFENYSPERDTQ